MSTKLKEDELKKVQELNGKLGQLKPVIGEMHIALSNAKLQEEDLMSQWRSANAELKALSDELRESYGNVEIDIATGEIKEPAAPKTEVEDDNQTDS
jgi:chromosome segregation ATPase